MSNDFAGCALFFEGIARSLPLNSITEYGPVSCSQTLQDACVNDLLSQATTQIKKLGSSSDGDNQSVCSALQSTLEANPPQSCQTIATVTWGSVVAKGELLLASLHLLLANRHSQHSPALNRQSPATSPKQHAIPPLPLMAALAIISHS